MNSDAFNPAYYNVVDQIYHARWTAAKLARFELVRRSIRRLWPDGHPTRLVHVAGTSGKGSVCRYLEAGFSLAGRAGSLTGPHLYDPRERFSIMGQEPAPAELIEAWEERIRPLCVELSLENAEHAHTYPEVYILIALVLFEKHDVALAAVEAGIGGRYDQTSALDAEAAVLTNVGRDHQELLGREAWQRALDKAGICRRSRPFFTSEREPETLAFIQGVCAHQDAPLTVVGAAEVRRAEAELAEALPEGPPPHSILAAEHQMWNAALSAAVVRKLAPEVESVSLWRAFSRLSAPGRFQKVGEGVYADVAHNANKVEAFLKELAASGIPAGKRIFIVGLSGRRSATEVLAPVLQAADHVFVAGASFKGREPHEVAALLETCNERNTPITVCPDPREALAQAQAMRGPEDVIVLTGSTYMIDQTLNPDEYLRQINASYGWRYHKEGPESRADLP